MLGLDFYSPRLSGAAIRAAGYGFVARYVENGYQGRANINAAEVRDLRANGVAIVLVWEKQKDDKDHRAALGYNAGVEDARAADAQARAVGLPGWPIYFCVDFELLDRAPNSSDPRAKMGPVADYLAGAATVVGHARMGVYGGYNTVKWALDANLVTYAWQSYAWSNFGKNQDPRIHLYQRGGQITVNGTTCDVDEQRKSDFGQQDRPGVVGGNDMAVFLKNLEDNTQYATQDGPFVSGVRESVGQATLKAWPGASCEIGLNNQEFTDRVNKSKALEGLAAVISGLPAQLAKSIPVGTGSLTADQLSAAVAEGVRQALDGMSQTTVLHEKSNSAG
ncbi:glycoside hydrolase domain-containing protein [Kutzneria sp. NPDC052558]|uniref:glycoside hydrolase domain-containing protein n=1 Tax=Kutzneria sp. NPDC052558 TaxID=3364121 RepID=UPI0037C848B4